MQNVIFVIMICCLLAACETRSTPNSAPDARVDDTSGRPLTTSSDPVDDMPRSPSASETIERASPSLMKSVEDAQRRADAFAAATATQDEQGRKLERRSRQPNDTLYAVTCCGDSSGEGQLHSLVVSAKDSGRSRTVPLPAAPEKPKGRVDLGDLDVQESCDENGFKKATYMRGVVFKKCYERELSNDPTLRGQVRVSVQVSEIGRASQIDILEDTLARDGVALCVKNTLRRISYPKGRVCTFTQTFGFRPRDDP